MKRTYYPVILSLVLGLLFSCDNNMEKSDNNCIADKYIYPIQPGSDEWKELDYQAMLDVCQIPQETLKNLCTDVLIDAYMDYPFLYATIFAYSNTSKGLEQVSQEFNGFAELIDRDDSGSELLLKYVSVDPADVNNREWSDLDKGLFMHNLCFFELTLAFEPIQDKLTHQERAEIMKDGLQKLEIKEKNNYSTLSKFTHLYLMLKILEAEKYPLFMNYVNEDDRLKVILSGSMIYYPTEMDCLFIKQIIEECLTN